MAVVLELSGDEVKALKSLQAVIDKQKKLIDEMEKGNKQGKKTKHSLSEAFGQKTQSDLRNLVVGIGSVTAATGLMRTAIGGVAADIQQLTERQTKAAQSQITLHSARMDLMRNMIGAGAAEHSAMRKAGEDIASQTGVEQQYIVSALAQAISATGGDQAKSIAHVLQAAKTMPDKPLAIGAYAGSLTDIANVTGSNDAAQNMGFLAKVSGLGRPAGAQDQARNIPIAIGGQLAYGSTPQGAAALFTSMTKATADAVGATSATAVIEFSKELKEHLPELKTTRERIKALQGDPVRARGFLDATSFPGKAEGVIEQMLTDKNSSLARYYANDMKAMSGNLESLVPVAQGLLDNMNKDPLSKNARISQILGTSAKDLEVIDKEAGEAGAVREQFIENLKNSGVNWWRVQKEKWLWNINTNFGRENPAGQAAEQMRKLGRELTLPEYHYSGGSYIKDERSATEIAIGNRLISTANQLEALNQKTDETNKLLGEVCAHLTEGNQQRETQTRNTKPPIDENRGPGVE